MSKTSNAKRGSDSKQRIAGTFIVVLDDMGVCYPMGWDEDCDGALCCLTESVAIFDSRKSARKAIAISAKFAQLRRTQGKPVNFDFIGDVRKNLRVVPCRPMHSHRKLSCPCSDGGEHEEIMRAVGH